MSAKPNKTLVRRFYEEVWGKGNVDVADEVFAARAVNRDGHEYRSLGQHSADGQDRQVFGGEHIPHREWQGG